MSSAAAPLAFSYVRFSTPEQSQGDSYRRQATMAADYAAAHGMTLDRSLNLFDLGVSAYRGRNVAQGALATFKKAVEDGRVPQGSVLLIENLDRLSRQTARVAARALEDIVDLGVDVVTLSDGRRYSEKALNEDPLAFLMVVIGFLRGHDESLQKSRRLSAVWSAKRGRAHDAAAKIMTARCPGWLTPRSDRSGFEVIPARAAIVLRVFEEAAKGTGEEAIAKLLNRDHAPPFAAGLHWHKSAIARMLRNAAAIGRLIPRTSTFVDGRRVRSPAGQPVEAYFPAVIALPLWSRVAALKTTLHARPITTQTRVVNLLAGLARCSICESSMTMVNKGAPPKSARYLVCAASKVGAAQHYAATRLEVFERALLGNGRALVAAAPQSGTLERKIRDDLVGVDQQLDGDLEAAREIAETIAAGNRSPTLAARLEEFEASIEARRATERDLTAQLVAAGGPALKLRLADLRTALDSRVVDRVLVNAALRAVVDRVVVDREAGSMRLHWRHGGTSRVELR